jgi:hypothetical protein
MDQLKLNITLGKYQLHVNYYSRQCHRFGNRIMSIPNFMPLEEINKCIHKALLIYFQQTKEIKKDTLLEYHIEYDEENNFWYYEVCKRNIKIKEEDSLRMPFTVIQEISNNDDNTLKSLSMWLFKINFNEEYNKYTIAVNCLYSRKCETSIQMFFPNILAEILSDKMYELDLYKLRSHYLSLINGIPCNYNNHITKYLFNDLVSREILTYNSLDRSIYDNYCFFTIHTRDSYSTYKNFDLEYQLGMESLSNIINY